MQYYSSSDSDDPEALLSAVMHGSHNDLANAILAVTPKALHASVNGKDLHGYTAMMWAALLGHCDDVLLLLESGADTEVMSSGGLSALQGAAEKGYLDIVVALLEAGARVNAQADVGPQHTALHLASANGHHQIVRVLLEHGAALGVRDRKGRTATDLCASVEVTAVLEEYSKLHLDLFKQHGDVEPERRIIEHLQEDQTANQLSFCHTTVSVVSNASSRSVESGDSIRSIASRTSRTSRTSSSSNSSSRILASRCATDDSCIKLKRHDTDEWLKAISALPAGPGMSQALCDTPWSGKPVHKIPLPVLGSPDGWRHVAINLVPSFPAHGAAVLLRNCGTDTRTHYLLTPLFTGCTTASKSCTRSVLSEIDPALLHGVYIEVWVLKRVGKEKHYWSRLMWLEVTTSSSGSNPAAFLCWSKTGYRAKCKRLSLSGVVSVQGPVFESAELKSLATTAGLSPRDGRDRSATGSTTNSSVSSIGSYRTQSPGKRGPWEWLRGTAVPIDGLVIQLRCSVGPSIFLKFGEDAPFSPYEWRAAIIELTSLNIQWVPS